ncbi:MAG TPA: HD domain-containing phosphohydrolase [Polyangiaceae bacterium]|jgi:response regulator RpfG family c-di-GMP phosphodiesterase|nr:HD domain-containing phosphohydrolase [Polyangiaceae bacterium]
MASKPRVLCVDDEPSVLEGLSLTLRRGCEVVTAQSGSAALDLLGRDPAIAVVLSDMRMPGMDGATFLGKARLVAPDATRLLLTGQADLASAIAAINEGRIFRFLNKPCSPPTLVAAIEAAVDMNRLVTAERVLLEQTLRGSIQMLTDVLALAAPTTFGQAVRIQRHARELASKVPGAEIWPVEVAAMLSQVGFITLAPATVEKLQEGKPLAQDEQLALDRLPAFAERLVSGIPRLEVVRSALKHLGTRYDGAGEAAHAPHGKAIPLGARVLAVVCDYDRLEAGGVSSQLALDTLRGRRGRYDPELLDLFAANLGAERRDDDVSEIPIRSLRVGMVLLDDVRTTAGRLLVARGHEATASLVERFRNFAPGFVSEPVRVSLKRLTGSNS